MKNCTPLVRPIRATTTKVVLCVVFCGGLHLRAGAGHPLSSVPVPPSLEIEVLDPGVDPEGKPKVLLHPDGSRRVDIPPTVLVHRYYYTGDRSFQAQLLTGGPCILAVNNPRDGRRQYIEAMLPPGAPRVTYRPDSILYDYIQQSVMLKFDHRGLPKVVYIQGNSTLAKVSEKSKHTLGAPRRLWRISGITEASKRAHQTTGEVASAVHDGVSEVGKAAATPVTRIIDTLPFVNAIRDSKRFRAERDRVDALEKAGEARLSSEATRATLR